MIYVFFFCGTKLPILQKYNSVCQGARKVSNIEKDWDSRKNGQTVLMPERSQRPGLGCMSRPLGTWVLATPTDVITSLD